MLRKVNYYVWKSKLLLKKVVDSRASLTDPSIHRPWWAESEKEGDSERVGCAVRRLGCNVSFRRCILATRCRTFSSPSRVCVKINIWRHWVMITSLRLLGFVSLLLPPSLTLRDSFSPPSIFLSFLLPWFYNSQLFGMSLKLFQAWINMLRLCSEFHLQYEI